MSITCACRPKPISCSASPRNRDRISVCSASAVRFIGTQRPSIAIENDVSTSSATAACVRASVSLTSTSPTCSRTPSLARAALADHPSYGVGDRAGDVPRLGVAERPLAGRARQLAGRTGLAHVALTLATAHPGGDVLEQRLAELAHRLRAQLELAVAGALEVAGVAQRLLEPLQRAGVDGGLVAELPGQLVEVDVVEPGAVVGLRELLGEVVEVGEVLEDAGAVAEPEPLLAVEALRPAPVLAGAQRLQVRVELRQLLHQLRRAERLLRPAASAPPAARRSSSSSSAGRRRRAAASASISSSTFCGFSGKKSPCLSMKSAKSSAVSSPRPCLDEQVVEVA